MVNPPRDSVPLRSAAGILMVGTSMQTMGGIATVVRVWRDAGLFDREHVRYITTHRDGGPGSKLAAATTGLARYAWALLRQRPRLVHIQLSFGASFWRKLLFALLAALRGVPYIMHLHGSEFRQFHDGGGRIRRAAIRWLFDHAALICTLSREWQAWVQGVTANPRVEIVYNAVAAPAAGAPAPTSVPGRLLFLGRMGQRKGTFDLLDAFASVVVRHPQATLHLGGDGDASPVRQRIATLGLQQHVRLLGWVRGDDKARELAQASVYVLPSYNEGLPMSVLEAMAAGLPIVSTPVGGIPDAVADGEQGYLVPPGDVPALAERLCRLLGDDALRQRMGQAAQARVRAQFSAEQAVQRLGQLYRQVETARAARRGE